MFQLMVVLVECHQMVTSLLQLIIHLVVLVVLPAILIHHIMLWAFLIIQTVLVEVATIMNHIHLSQYILKRP